MTETKIGRPTKYDPEYGERIIAKMSEGYSLVAAAADVDVGRSTVYRWIDEHPEFAKLIELAKAKRQAILERTLLEATTSPVVTSRIFALKNASPDWREKTEVDVSGQLDHKHEIDVSGLSDEALAALQEVLRK